MRVIARRTLREFWERHPAAGQPLRAWFKEAEKAAWAKPAQVKARYASASVIGRNRLVFDIGGNKYRLVVVIKYHSQFIYIRFVGTHADYNRIDAATI